MKTIYLKGDVGYEITADGIKNIIDIESKTKLRVLVNSPGGSVIEAFEIYNLFKSYRGEVEFVIFPYAASAMSYIIMAGDKISATQNSIFMAHKAWGLVVGDSDEMKREAEIMQGLDSIIAEAYLKRLGGTKEEMLSKMKNEIWAIGYEQLIDSKIIDNIIDDISVVEEELEDPEKQEIEESIAEAKGADVTNILKMRIEQTKTRLKKDEAKYRSGLEKAAAMLSNLNPGTGKDKIIKKEEVKMNLKEFLESNAEAQAEYDANLQAVRAEGITDSDTKVLSERNRIAEILKYASANLSDTAIKALEDGLDAGEYAKAELAKQKEIRANATPSIFGSLLKTSQLPADSNPEPSKNMDDFEKKAKEKVSKIFNTGVIM